MSTLAVMGAFLALTVLTLFPAIMVISTRNVLHAGFWLLPCLIGVAGLYAMLDAHFFVVAQVLVYIGAILVLILFSLMLTRDVMNPKAPQHNGLVGVAVPICATMSAICALLLARHPWPAGPVAAAGAQDQTVALGRALIGTYALPFEAASVLLLAALVGAIVLAKAPQSEPPAAERIECPGGEK
ncbi:MAG: NADH-quinone oxidoreductase subunit J [Armatimonadetes bacterium]|nr:NADH-quinone oxidoreductase subunit J [Armatimonadota bacterium]